MVVEGVTVFFLFVFGTAIGSFLHVVAERYATGESIVGRLARHSPASGRGDGGSYCPHCKKILSARELVPIVSYTINRAKCAGCKANIPVHYPLIELLTGLLAVALLFSGNVLAFIAGCILVILIRIDSKLMLLPDGYIYALTGVAIAHAYFSGTGFTDIVYGVLAGCGSLYLLWITTGGAGIGFGDVKLMIPLSILFGFSGIIALLFFSFIAGGLVSVFLLASKRVTPKTAIPFGPFLAGSALCILVFPEIADRFFSFIGVYYIG